MSKGRAGSSASGIIILRLSPSLSCIPLTFYITLRIPATEIQSRPRGRSLFGAFVILSQYDSGWSRVSGRLQIQY